MIDIYNTRYTLLILAYVQSVHHEILVENYQKTAIFRVFPTYLGTFWAFKDS